MIIYLMAKGIKKGAIRIYRTYNSTRNLIIYPVQVKVNRRQMMIYKCGNQLFDIKFGIRRNKNVNIFMVIGGRQVVMKQFFIYKDEDIIAMMEGTTYEFINEQSCIYLRILTEDKGIVSSVFIPKSFTMKCSRYGTKHIYLQYRGDRVETILYMQE